MSQFQEIMLEDKNHSTTFLATKNPFIFEKIMNFLKVESTTFEMDFKTKAVKHKAVDLNFFALDEQTEDLIKTDDYKQKLNNTIKYSLYDNNYPNLENYYVMSFNKGFYSLIESSLKDDSLKLHSYLKEKYPKIPFNKMDFELFNKGIKALKTPFDIDMYHIECSYNIFKNKPLLSYNRATHPKESFLESVNIKEEIQLLNLPFEAYDYQILAVEKAFEKKRIILDSATGSGKSLIIYLILMISKKYNLRSALIVPSIDLTTQMYNDFLSYGMTEKDAVDSIRKIGGDNKIKSLDKDITITTWQSLQHLSEGVPLINQKGEFTLSDNRTVKKEDLRPMDSIKVLNPKNFAEEFKQVQSIENTSTKYIMLKLEVGVFIAKEDDTFYKMYRDRRTEYKASSLKVGDYIVKGIGTSTDKIKVLGTKASESNFVINYIDNLDTIDVNIIDEAHTLNGDVLQDIVEKSTNAFMKIGCTGTVPRNIENRYKLIGALGEVQQIINGAGLISRGLATPIEITQVFIQHDNEARNLAKKFNFDKEVKFITTHEKRNKFVSGFCEERSKEGNTLVLYTRKEHGMTLVDNAIRLKGFNNFEFHLNITRNNKKIEMMKDFLKNNKKIFINDDIEGIKKLKKSFLTLNKKEKILSNTQFSEFISNVNSAWEIGILRMDGDISSKIREKVLVYMENNNNLQLFGTWGVLSTGINFKNLLNLVFAMGLKSNEKVIQGIGRMLRLHVSKSCAYLFDIIDDMSSEINGYSGAYTKENYMLKHGYVRADEYMFQGYPIVDEMEVQI